MPFRQGFDGTLEIRVEAMTKLFTGGIITETNTFAPMATRLEDWRTSDDPEGNETLGFFDQIAGLATERGWETFFGFGAYAEPAGKTTADAWEFLKGRLLEDLRSAMPVDLVVMPLHGAMIAEGCDDCEGHILAAVRSIVGPDVPIGVGLDAHAHLSRQMVEEADILVFMKEWPHIDVPLTIENAFRLTADFFEGKTRPHMSVEHCRMIAPYHTLEEPLKSLIDQMKAAEQEDDVLSVSLIHGFWHADVPDMGSKVLVITDDAPAKGAEMAKRFASDLFKMRGKTHPRHLTLEEGLNSIQFSDLHPVVVGDLGDIPSGGGPGDVTLILQGLIERKIGNAALAYIWDPQSIDEAIAAGEGARIELEIGGKTTPQFGGPTRLTCTVKGVFPDHRFDEDDGYPTWVGDVAVVHADGIDIVLARERVAALSSQHFETIGIDARSKSVLVVKSANNFYAGFQAIAGKTIYVDAGGVTGGEIRDFEYTRITRPMWPMDEDPFADGASTKQ